MPFRTLLPYLTILLLCALACNSVYDITLLHGSWQVASWREVANGYTIDQRMDFEFNADKSYLIDYGSEKELGSYYLAGEFLHTKEDGGIEKSVRIKSLSSDSLVLNMNRAGSLEEIILIRE